MEKTLETIENEDLNNYPVWYFPTDDQFTLKPCKVEDDVVENELIVKATYSDAVGQKFGGYLYWGERSNIEYLKPVLFIDEKNGRQINFWSGIRLPNVSDLQLLLQNCVLPVSFKSEQIFGLKEISGILEGIYYLNAKRNVEVKTSV